MTYIVRGNLKAVCLKEEKWIKFQNKVRRRARLKEQGLKLWCLDVIMGWDWMEPGSSGAFERRKERKKPHFLSKWKRRKEGNGSSNWIANTCDDSNIPLRVAKATKQDKYWANIWLAFTLGGFPHSVFSLVWELGKGTEEEETGNGELKSFAEARPWNSMLSFRSGHPLLKGFSPLVERFCGDSFDDDDDSNTLRSYLQLDPSVRFWRKKWFL